MKIGRFLILVLVILAMSAAVSTTLANGEDDSNALIDDWIAEHADYDYWLTLVEKGEIGTVSLPGDGDISQAEALRIAAEAILRLELDIPFADYGPIEFTFYEARYPVDFELDNHRYWAISFYPPDSANYQDICYVGVDSVTGVILSVTLGSRG